MPIHWGKNQPGMSAKEECFADTMGGDNEFHGFTREDWWNEARDMAIVHAKEFDRCGYHKQIVNRLLEPFSHIKVVCTATEYDNFFYLRRHPDAQPEIQELAEQMWKARENSHPVSLLAGDWHVPYYREGFWTSSIGRETGDSVQDAIAISSSCCAQVSYRRLDDSLEKAAAIYERLVDSKPVHASPFEHQGSPMKTHFTDGTQLSFDSISGCTHMDVHGNYWSGNLKGWIQNRQLIDGNVCNEYNP